MPAHKMVCALSPVLFLMLLAEPATPQISESASFFSLETVDQTRRVESDTLFAGASTTLLAFWTTHCAECVHRLEACQALQEWGRDDGLAVVGVNFDETPTSKIQLLARQATPRMLQLYDGGGRVAAEYGAGAHSFSAIVVDPEGIVRSAHFDVSPDSIAALRPELRRVMDEALGEEPGARRGVPGGSHTRRPGVLEELGLLKQQRLEAHAWGRFRWMDIDTSGSGATGVFGEEIEPGSSFRHRLALELIYSVTPALKAGGLLWLSNEGLAVLRSGPDYLSSEWGSAYVRYETKGRVPGLGSLGTSLRAGYYDVFFTPLTLMRWDKDDSPISGGQRVQGCACGGGAGPAGVLRSESLEQLAPKYRFEGARWDVSWMERVDLLGLYARPFIRYPDDPIQCVVVDEANMRYRQELYAGRLTAHISVPWGSDLAALSGTALQTQDFPEDWDPRCTTRPAYDPGNATLLGADLRVPLPLRALGTAEIVRSLWEARPLGDPPAPEAIAATAVRGTCNFDIRPRGSVMGLALEGLRAVVDLGYQHVGANFFSPYSALSYESNLRPSEDTTLPGLAGPRGSLRVDWGSWGFGAFVKQLDPVDESADPTSETAAGKRRMGSVWFDNEIWSGGVFTAGWVTDQREPLTSQAGLGLGKETRRTWIAGFEQELAPKCLLMLEAQFLRGESGRDEYETRTLRAMVDVEF
jgi:peroxiredoxin